MVKYVRRRVLASASLSLSVYMYVCIYIYIYTCIWAAIFPHARVCRRIDMCCSLSIYPSIHPSIHPSIPLSLSRAHPERESCHWTKQPTSSPSSICLILSMLWSRILSNLVYLLYLPNLTFYLSYMSIHPFLSCLVLSCLTTCLSACLPACLSACLPVCLSNLI